MRVRRARLARWHAARAAGSNHSQLGFTLIEILVATTLMAIVMVPIGMATMLGWRTIFGVEQQLFRFKHNFVRAIGELSKPSFEDPRLGALGRLLKAENIYANMALRVRSGILQVEAGTRRAMQAGYDEGYVTVVKRF